MQKQWAIVLVIVAAIAFCSVGVYAANCGGTIVCNCGDNLTSSRTLNASDNFTGCAGNGLSITVSDVVLDCDGYSVIGDGSGPAEWGVGIILSVNNVTVKNCNISNFDPWAVLVNGNNNTIDNNILINCATGIATTDSGNNFTNNIIYKSSLGTTRGIYLNNGAGNNNLINNTIYNYLYGVHIAGASNNNLLRENNIYSNTYGVYMVSSSNVNTIYHNNIYNSNQDEVYSDAAIELSYNNEGNYWGRSSCPVFIAGTDSNAANVVDSYAYNSLNGWLTEDPAACCGSNIYNDVTLTYNLTGCSGNGLNIDSAGVTLDCNGYAISGSGGSIGVNVSSSNNAVVTDCIIHTFNDGIDVDSSSNVNLTDNTIYNISSGDGIGISQGSARIAGNNITGGTNGIFCSEASMRVENNDISDANDGIYVGFSCGTNQIINNNIHNNSNRGIVTLASTGSHNITENNISGCYQGLVLGDNSPKVYHNNIFGNSNLQVYSYASIELSVGGEGNYWGRTSCPVFIAGTDSNDVNVVDSYGYNSSDGWLTGNPADCCGLGGICGCGHTVSGSITLTTDLSAGGTCFTIGADNITIDCDGYTLTGQQSGMGISSDGYNNITIKNCNIDNFSSEIYMANSVGHTILNNNLSKDISLAGLYFSSINDTLVKDNRIFYNYYGIYLSNSDNNTIEDNTVYNNSDAGISLTFSDDNTLKDNIVFNNTDSGILIDYSDNNDITGGEIYNNNLVDSIGEAGIHLESTIYSHVSGVYMHNNKKNAVYGWDNDYSVIESNNIDSNCGGNAGISLGSTVNVTIKNNNITNGTGYAIELQSSTSATILNNNINDNSNYGIYSYGGSSADIENGEFISNTNYGIYALTGPVDWTISQYTICRDNDVRIDYGNITFNGGSLELDNCTMNLEGAIINLTGTITSLEKETRAVAVNTSEDFDFSAEDSNITLYLSSGVTTTIAVSTTTPGSSPSGLNTLKGIDISVDSTTKGSLTWALIKIFYSDAELSAAGISESLLKIYYYNETAGDWQLEPVQGVDTANNYVWANVTHLSLFGIFGSTQPSGGGGGRCTNMCRFGERICLDGSMYVCGNYDYDSCTEWGIEECMKGYECEKGVCVEMPCVEDWICADWSEECIGGMQVRECADWNSCSTTALKPDIERQCVEAIPGAPLEMPAMPTAAPEEEVAPPAKTKFGTTIVALLLVIATAIALNLAIGGMKKKR